MAHPPSESPSLHLAPLRLERAQWWRLLAILALPLGIILGFSAIYERIPQRAGDLSFDIVVNHLSQDACLDFRDQATPESLTEFSCKTP